MLVVSNNCYKQKSQETTVLLSHKEMHEMHGWETSSPAKKKAKNVNLKNLWEHTRLLLHMESTYFHKNEQTTHKKDSEKVSPAPSSTLLDTSTIDVPSKNSIPLSNIDPPFDSDLANKAFFYGSHDNTAIQPRRWQESTRKHHRRQLRAIAQIVSTSVPV
jgi:hypothetical protein